MATRKTKAKTLRNRDRRHDHINRGERVFLPQSRMRHIRHEEAVLNSRNNHSKKPDPNPAVVHWDCQCGSVECQANPRISHVFYPRHQ